MFEFSTMKKNKTCARIVSVVTVRALNTSGKLGNRDTKPEVSRSYDTLSYTSTIKSVYVTVQKSLKIFHMEPEIPNNTL